MNIANVSMLGFMTSMAFTMFIVVGSDQDSIVFEEGISKWNLIPFAYVVDLANWSSMDCQEKHENLEQGMTLKNRLLMAENYEPSVLNPISFTLQNCLENEN